MKLGDELLQRAMRELRMRPKPSVSSDTLAGKSGRPRLLAALSSTHRALINRQLRVSVHQSKRDTPSPDASPLMVRLTISLLDLISITYYLVIISVLIVLIQIVAYVQYSMCNLYLLTSLCTSSLYSTLL